MTNTISIHQIQPGIVITDELLRDMFGVIAVNKPGRWAALMRWVGHTIHNDALVVRYMTYKDTPEFDAFKRGEQVENPVEKWIGRGLERGIT